MMLDDGVDTEDSPAVAISLAAMPKLENIDIKEILKRTSKGGTKKSVESITLNKGDHFSEEQYFEKQQGRNLIDNLGIVEQNERTLLQNISYSPEDESTEAELCLIGNIRTCMDNLDKIDLRSSASANFISSGYEQRKY
ncbi:hypothetical protein Avbf_18676 [Armadillidium vulgare]|nr:hypothetical protein Avbf_18676 [Armadillidium vulgare]